MSNYIVLVKQVPDVSRITDNAFDPATGTLIRSRLPSVVNELDAQAFAFAHRMRNLQKEENSKIVALTMGPPMAEEVLRYSFARNADAAVLLTDRSLGGADTWATANPLAYAVRKIVKDVFDGDEDYYVVCGMQSVDGDTAQVPAQMASELKIPCIAYATDCAWENDRFVFTRIISGGSQKVSAIHKPAIVTIAKYEYTMFAGFARSRQARRMDVKQWGADDIKATHIGAKGSKTAVIRVFPPGKTTRKCQHVADAKELAKAIISEYRTGEGAENGEEQAALNYVLPEHRENLFIRDREGTSKESKDFAALKHQLDSLGVKDLSDITDEVKEKILANEEVKFHKRALDDMLNGLATSEPTYTGEMWVVAEHRDGKIHPATFELIGKNRELADSLNTKVGVVVAGNKSCESMAPEFIAAGADKVYVIEDPLLEEFDPNVYCKAMSDLFKKYVPQVVLYAATPQGRCLAPMIAYETGCGLTADCTGLDIRDSSRRGLIGILMQTRPALGGNVMATIMTKNSSTQMATARPGVMKRLPVDPSRKGEVVRHSVTLSKSDRSLDILATEMGSGDVSFDVDVIVAGGKGMQNRDSFNQLLDMLKGSMASSLDTKVEIGASRAAVEQGFIERVYQVGQTGTAVGPKLYVAVGISGAIQHMIGVANSGTIVAINSDPAAPVFKQCDYYIVGTAEKVIPELAKELQRL